MGKSRQHGGDRRVQFVNDNMELLGFGNARDALIQTVKELFENALDAVVSGLQPHQTETNQQRHTGMVRLKVQWNSETQLIDVVCGDTGVGFEAHEICRLCCGAFETTKTQTGPTLNKPTQCGKYGLGLKAAMLYSQQFTPGASLKIVTTSHSSEVLFIELRIDPQSEEPAIVQRVVTFAVDEHHRQFSGTEMRIAIPPPDTPSDVDHAMDVLALYFQSLRYTVPENIGAEIELELGESRVELSWADGVSGVDHFVSDFGISSEDVVCATKLCDGHEINCMAAVIRQDNEQTSQPPVLQITVLRYANHVPLVNADDLYLCSLTSSVLSNRVWKKLGYQCSRNTSSLVNQIIASPVSNSSAMDNTNEVKLVLAIDVSSSGATKYSNLRKSAMDKSYLKAAQGCVRQALEQLHTRGDLPSPSQTRDNEMLTVFAPLVAAAASSILQRAIHRTNRIGGRQELPEGSSLPSTDQLTAALQDALARQLGI